jgi:L-threonylcarbamoyladenylate synthase
VAALREALLAGGVALVPTDTVYGLAAALDSAEGVAALYALKGRPRGQPVQVLLFAPRLLEEALAPLDPATRRAAQALLPGPVTCIVADPAGRYRAAAGDAPGTVGIRAPVVSGALAALDLPLVATSANEPGGPDPRTLDDVPERIRAGVACAVDAGPLPGTASAVVDLQGVPAGGPARLLRPGADPGAVEAALAAAGVRLVPG